MINLSYYIIPLVHLQTLFASLRGPALQLGFRNNVSPRQILEEMEKSGKVKPHTLAKLRRRQAAHENCFENEPIFIGAVVAGNAVGLSTRFMNIMSILYFVFRCLYIYLYLKTTSQKTSYLRSVIYWFSSFCYLMTFIKCGLKLNSII
ncbi:uncharacterized protein L203_100339 [Cryptococcus depauperatus CBS 7841]|uniref:Uncharacterized protein n=1 Tax=Cryptococcus depauperatus CBS 7841 TaxID=1295531 RepID=A0AAJ8JMW1_9TREE